MAEPMDVARHLIWLATQEEEPDYLTHLQLQKLLYYVQGWHLAVFGTPLFAGRIEAWKYGPVVREVYPQFAEFRYQPIPAERGAESGRLTAAQRAVIDSVWQEYKRYSPSGLREMTHREPPWLDARRGYGPDDRCDAEISHESMRAHFAERQRERAVPGLDLADVYAAIEEFDRGGGRDHTDVFARLRARS